MTTLDDNIEKRILAQKILESDTLTDALEYIKNRYKVNISTNPSPISAVDMVDPYTVMAHTPRPITYEAKVYNYDLNYYSSNPQSMNHYMPSPRRYEETSYHLMRKIFESRIIKVEVIENPTFEYAYTKLIFDIPAMHNFEKIDNSFRRIK